MKSLYSCCTSATFCCSSIRIEKSPVATRLIFVPSALIGCRIRRPTKIDIPVPTTILNPAKTNNGYSVGFPADSAGEIECRDNKKIKPRKHSSVTKIEMKTILAK
ncbi:hypothetical protein CUZ96_2459 [Enterococcus lactis]|nr:hypothetical protein [Enterococcus lactis]